MTPNPTLKAVLGTPIAPVAALIPGQEAANHSDLTRAVNDMVERLNQLTACIVQMDHRVDEVHHALVMPLSSVGTPHSLVYDMQLMLPSIDKVRADMARMEQTLMAIGNSFSQEQSERFKLNLGPRPADQQPVLGGLQQEIRDRYAARPDF